MSAQSHRPVTVAYSGAHQAFQIALAAHEAALLDVFHGSVFDAPGKVGHWLARLLGNDAMASRRVDGIPGARLHEIPLPLLLHRVASVARPVAGIYPWYRANFAFDRRVARSLAASSAQLFVGTETCAAESFQAAGRRGMTKVLDCPAVHPHLLTRLLAESAADLSMAPPAPFDTPELAARKADEFAMADCLLVISDLQRQSFIDAGIPPSRLVQIPLWADPALWYPEHAPAQQAKKAKLRVLFVGTLGLRKGLPYLVQALDKLHGAVQLTLVGVNSGEADPFLARARAEVRYTGALTKAALRRQYADADVLVLPSLVDTFGFVAMEAMACGLPVIVTDNCGVPVPDAAWRVPSMDAGSLAARLQYYVDDRDALRTDGAAAVRFAAQFTPGHYRARIAGVLRDLLAARVDPAQQGLSQPLLAEPARS